MYGNTNHNSGSPQRQIDQLWMQLCTVSWRLSCQSQKRNRPITKCRIKNTGIRNHSASKIICTHAENCRKSSLAVFRYALPELYLDYNRVMRKFRICVIDDSEFDRLRFTTLLKQVDYPVAIYSFSCVRDFLDSREKNIPAQQIRRTYFRIRILLLLCVAIPDVLILFLLQNQFEKLYILPLGFIMLITSVLYVLSSDLCPR